MSRFPFSMVAAAAMMTALAGPVLAESTPEGGAAVPVELPQVLRDAGLGEVTGKPSRHGMRIEGQLQDGTRIGAMLNEAGELRGLRAEGEDAALPAALIERLVPQAVRGEAVFGELSRIDAVFLGGRGIMLAGEDAQSNDIRAVFAEDGTLLRFGRGEDRGPGMRGPDGKPGPEGKPGKDGHGPREGHGRDHGPREGGPRGEGPREGGPREGGPREGGPREDGPREGRGPVRGQPLAAEEIRASLTEAGYTGVGEILQQGQVTVAQATNPEGEPVLVELGRDGKVLRELNR